MKIVPLVIALLMAQCCMAQRLIVIGNLDDRDCRDIDSIATVFTRSKNGFIVEIKDEQPQWVKGPDAIEKLDAMLRSHLADAPVALLRIDIDQKIKDLMREDPDPWIMESEFRRNTANVESGFRPLRDSLTRTQENLKDVTILVALNRPLTQRTVEVVFPTKEATVGKCTDDRLGLCHWLRLKVYGDTSTLSGLQMEFSDSLQRPLLLPKASGGDGTKCIPPLNVIDHIVGNPQYLQNGFEICLRIPWRQLFEDEKMPRNMRDDDGNLVGFWPYHLKIRYHGLQDVRLPSKPQEVFFRPSANPNSGPCLCTQR